jgi:ssDNA-binding Zn-finger/Zn-ribbon topoisomerase 1
MMTAPTSPPHTSARPVRNGSRNGSPLAALATLTCPVCTAPLPSARARYCSAACRQQAFRLRHPRDATTEQVTRMELATLRRVLQRPRALVAQTIYACPRCEERFVGERRCPECHVFCRALGLGGHCPECDHLILLAELIELLGKEVNPAPSRT